MEVGVIALVLAAFLGLIFTIDGDDDDMDTPDDPQSL